MIKVKSINVESIDGDKYDRVFVVGDLHGSYSMLFEKLKEIKFNPKTDLLVSVGDLIDRGKENLECLRLVSRPWFKAVIGNHEDMALKAISAKNKHSMPYGRDQRLWDMNGGNWFFNLQEENLSEYDEAFSILSEEISLLPLVIEVIKNGKKYVICHADYPFNNYIFNDPNLGYYQFEVVWSRDRIARKDESVIKGADHFYFGHTPLKEVITLGNRTYLDTGAVFGNKLTLIELK